MVINGKSLLCATPIKNMSTQKNQDNGVSWGLTECGYDIRIKQKVEFLCDNTGNRKVFVDGKFYDNGRFALASAIEEFQMPPNLMGVVHDKSTWARQGLSVFNTIIEPGWEGFLTLELDYKRDGILCIPAGSGIAQVIFHQIKEVAEYNGKYQNQADQPVEAIFLAK